MEEIYKNLDLNNLEGEEWRDVVGYEGLYAVSNLGRVKSLKFGKEKILYQILNNNNGYLQLTLCKDGKRKNYLVHRLVGNAFLDNPNNLPCFNHKNEIKTYNRAVNLEPCDHKYNLNYKNTQARRVASTDYKAFQARRVASTDFKAIARKNAEKLTNRQDLSKQVYQYSLDGELVAIWQSIRECGRNGYNFGNVASCCRGELKHYKGYNFSYQEL